MTIILPRRFGASLLLVVTIAAGSAQAEDKHVLHRFEKHQLSDEFFSEGATFADINRDGQGDVVAGPYWYAGPEFKEKSEIYPAKPFDINAYSDNFFAFSHDFDGDKWDDVLVVGFPGVEAFWYRNPQGKPGHWEKHLAFATVDNESPTLTDVTGDGQPELVCSSGGQLGYAEIPKDPPTPWHFVPVTPKRDYQRFTHGLGVGDVNGDGRMDLLEKDGWWEQPASLGDGKPWQLHDVKFSEGGGAQMYAYDFDGDGDNDVVTSKAAHAYGLSWFEQVNDGDKIAFKEHLFMGEKPEQNDYGVAFSQLHAVDLADIDGDGIKDIVTGKRYWAHSEHDPGSLEPAVLYWFKTVRDNGTARFIPYKIDDDSGVGTQVVVGDLNGDKLPDVIVGSKKGVFATVHHAEEVDKQAWENEQPTRRPGVPEVESASPQPREVNKPITPEATAVKIEDAPKGFPATADGGRELNLDFEKGDLSDWTAEGNAFDGQPVRGDTVTPRRSDSISGHQGDYWIGTYERRGDGVQGTLTSVPFKVTHPWASFLVGGGGGNALSVEVIRKDTGDVVLRASGRAREEMQPAVVDLRELGGKEIFLRIVDHGSAGWAHVNFDNFRFYDEEPPSLLERQHAAVLKPDSYPYAGLPAEEAARVMQVPEGFSVKVCAAEPDVKQPIAMALDHRGRLWVAEGYDYPVRALEGQGHDRILIFEDTDGDGKFDSRKVFIEKLNLVSGLELGFGGVWVGAAPYLQFIPDRDGDDTPDGPPENLLDGWAYQDTHETLNTFIWGPDGWLYGCHGVFTHSRVGKPGTPDADRTPLNAAVWRYHPTRHKFEIFSEGTSNPWGVDFDDHGQAFSTACVIPHLYFNIQGGRYQRQAGEHFNRHTYADIQTIADHRHYLGENPHGGNGSSSDAGGGHAHAGAMIYLGGAWPDEYRGRIFMNNIHGQRLNTDILKPQGSGFVGSHGPDFLLTGDIASQILNIRYGPDGQAYFIDWYDTNACHHNNVDGHDRSNGRVYKVVYGDAKASSIDLSQKTDVELAELALDKNDWFVRHARRALQERAATGAIETAARERLVSIATTNEDATRRLRAIWALHVTGGLPAELGGKLLADGDQYVRAWTIQLLLDGDQPPLERLVPQLAAMARDDSSQVVRLYIASALGRLPVESRWAAIEGLLRHAEDASDHNLPLMYWYAAEPLAEAEPSRALNLALACRETMPLVAEFLVRRIASLDRPEAQVGLTVAARESGNEAEQLLILKGLRQALGGQRRVKAPDGWDTLAAKVLANGSEEVRDQVVALGVTYGDESALEAVRARVASADAPAEARREALESLLAVKDPQLCGTLIKLLDDDALRGLALSGLAMYDDGGAPAAVLQCYANLPPDQKRIALATLCSRATYGAALLKAIADKQIAAADLSADLVRQLHQLKSKEVDELVTSIWGQVRSTPADKVKLIADYRQLLAEHSSAASPELGRAVFAKTCYQCHTLYGAGGKVGPDLTGSNRSDLEYLLSNIVDPSAVMAKEYFATIVYTLDGRALTGIAAAEDDKTLTLKTATETVVIPKDEIDERTVSELSMMPEDQLKQFTPAEVASLFAYLQGKSQVPMHARQDNQALIFNGHDLAGWKGDEKLWSVQDGEIVGKSPGIDHNTFLVSDLEVGDFKLSLEVKLVDNVGNSGVQFRTEPIDNGEMRGYQADVGEGWWGKLYEENGRALLWDKSGEEHLKKGEWNTYEIEARGSRVRTWLNGQLCVDLDDPDGARRGIIALQLHSGGPMEVRFRNLKLEVLDDKPQ